MREHPNATLVLKGLDFVSKRDTEGLMSILPVADRKHGAAVFPAEQ